MQATTLHYPTVFFWYGVLTGMHETTPQGERTDLWAYALDTICSGAMNYEPEQRQAADWLAFRGDLHKTQEFRDRAWDFARDFVLSGRAARVFIGAPDPLGHLSVSAEGIAERVELPKPQSKPQPKRKPKPKAYDSWDPFGFGGTFGESEVPF